MSASITLMRSIFRKIQSILDDVSVVNEAESLVGVLTASKRDVWAEVRQKHFLSGTNKSSLSSIEGSAFVLILDDEPYNAKSEVGMNKVI